MMVGGPKTSQQERQLTRKQWMKKVRRTAARKLKIPVQQVKWVNNILVLIKDGRQIPLSDQKTN